MAVEKVENEQCHEDTKENQPTKPSEIRVTLRHMAAVISEAYNTDASIQTLGETLPLHQQLVTASLIRLQGDRTCMEVDVKKLYAVYLKHCEMKKLQYQRDRDFRDMLTMLEGRGVVVLKKTKGLQSKVTLRLSKEDLGNILKEDCVISLFA